MAGFVEKLSEKVANPQYQCVKLLEREIGYVGWGEAADASDKVLAEWTRQLARVVAHHTAPPLHAYGEDVMRWADDIQGAETAEAVLDRCEAVHGWILAADNDDGWPTDRAGSTLNAVCLGGMYSLDPERAKNSRWPAEASQQVWKWVTGAGNGNDVVAISRAAWQRHLYGQVLAIVKHAP